MIVVDSSVWIDYFNGRKTENTDLLHSLLGRMPIIMGDLILTEVLQGFQKDRDFRIARDLLHSPPTSRASRRSGLRPHGEVSGAGDHQAVTTFSRTRVRVLSVSLRLHE